MGRRLGMKICDKLHWNISNLYRHSNFVNLPQLLNMQIIDPITLPYYGAFFEHCTTKSIFAFTLRIILITFGSLNMWIYGPNFEFYHYIERSIHNGYTFSMFSIEFSRFPPHYWIQDPMAASGEISPKLGKCPLPPSPFPPEYEWSWTNGWNWLSLIPFIVRLFLFTIYLSKTEEKTGVPSSADAEI